MFLGSARYNVQTFDREREQGPGNLLSEQVGRGKIAKGDRKKKETHKKTVFIILEL